MQGWNLLTSLKALGTHHRADIFVHHTPKVPQLALQAFKRLGARLVEVEPFGDGPAVFCNKIQQLHTQALRGYDNVILCDTDIFFISCPTKIAVGSNILAKPVDLPNPPERMWRQLLLEAGFPPEVGVVSPDFEPESQTFLTNFNGGFYVLPGDRIEVLAEAWTKWARHCLAKTSLLGAWLRHSDQLGFGMALLELGWPFEYLPIGWNFPTHLSPSVMAKVNPVEIHALHYHNKLNAHGQLVPAGVDWVDQYINVANAALTAGRRNDFDNFCFWDFRYHWAPELGSGLGSRGEARRQKDAFLRPILTAISRDSILDVGCGDLEVMRSMPFSNYTGIDVSQTAIEIARKKQPTWRFQNSSLADIDTEAYDWSLCLDVLIHQSSAMEFDEIVANLVRVSTKGILVSGYADASANSGIVFAHDSLPDALKSHKDIEQVVPIGSYRDVTLYLALKAPALPWSRWDASVLDIAYGCREIADWPLLLDLVELSRKAFGFFPKTIIRTIEYPWFAHRLISKNNRRVLDLGAGVSALPLWLAKRGCEVVTLDFSTTLRNPAIRTDWNEWGFLDYGLLDERIISHNLDAQVYEPEETFDIVYSVSVLEHMPASVRRAIIAKLPLWLAPGGRIYLSLDLIPGTHNLWPLSEGREVDETGTHGTLEDCLAEIRAAGLRIVELSLRSGIAGSRTDLAFIEAAVESSSVLGDASVHPKI